MMVDNISGWWFQPSPLKNHGVKVSWDDMTFPTEWKVRIQSCCKPPSRFVMISVHMPHMYMTTFCSFLMLFVSCDDVSSPLSLIT